MPKRALRFYFENTPTSFLKQLPRRRKSFIEKNNGSDGIQAEAEEDNDEIDVEMLGSLRRSKQMRRMKYNQNNEIERLLLHNGSGLFYHVDHSNFPSFNVGLWPQEDQDQLCTYPSCSFSIPRPIYIADSIQEKIDLCYRRPMTREFHRKRMYKSKAAYQSSLKNKIKRNEEKEGIYHSAVYDIAERVLTQPDPYFQASYDFYYTGGNLCTLPTTGSVVHATGTNLQTLVFNEFPMAEDYTVTNSLRSLAKMKSTENCEIFEIQPMVTPSFNNCFIARQRNVVSLNYLNESKNLKILTQFRTKSTPFISFAQSDRNHNKLLLTTMKQHIRLYDMGDNVPKLVKLYEIEPEAVNVSWNMIRPWRENTFLYANEYKFCVIDIRTTPAQWMASATSAIEHNYLCDHISSIKPSEFNNLFYVATNHKLHCMDIRHIKNSSFNDPDAVVCRWSHQMQYSPLMMDTCRLNNTEYIALSSPIAGDLHICQLSRQKNVNKMAIMTTNRVPKHIFNSPCLPYQPPTIMEAYDCARLQGNCLQPEANLHNRLLACTTGLSFCKPSLEGNEAALGLLLTSNSLGDIFLQTLNKREDEEGDSRGNARSNEVMVDFEKKLLQQRQPLNYTEIKNMKAMRKIFLCKYLNNDINPKYDLDAMDDSFSENEPPTTTQRASPVKKKRKRLHLGRWQKSFATLHAYKDALVPDLLSIWDIETEDEKHAAIHLGNLETSRHIKPDPEKKVQTWLAKNHKPDTAPMVAIPQISEISRCRERTENVIPAEPDTSLYLNQTQDSIDFENVIQSTQIVDTTIPLNTSAFDESTQIKVTSMLPNTSALKSMHIVDTTIQLNTSAVDANLNTSTTSMNRSKTKKKSSKKYVKGF